MDNINKMLKGSAIELQHEDPGNEYRLQLEDVYSKTYYMRPLKEKTKIGFQDSLSLNAGQKYCRMLKGEHSATLCTFIKLPFVNKIFVLSI